jgi:hypothetical protein
MPAEVKARVTRPWLNWIAVALALIGVGAFFVEVPDPSPTSHNYARERAVGDFLREAVSVVSMAAPVVAIGLGIIANAFTGTLAGLGAVLLVVAWPGRLCCGGDELNVIGFLRAINSAQDAYSSSCANGKGFANTLEALVTPRAPGGSAYLGTQSFRGVWRGYAVTMQIPERAAVNFVACDGTRVVSSYFVEAHLISAIPGRRNFATDERGTIYSNDGGTPIQPGMAGATPIQ